MKELLFESKNVCSYKFILMLLQPSSYVIVSGFNRDKVSHVDYICLYIIATHFGTYYTGITNSLVRRWHEHITGKSSYLRRVIPRSVVHVEFYESRREAARKERYIKDIGASKYLLKLKYKK